MWLHTYSMSMFIVASITDFIYIYIYIIICASTVIQIQLYLLLCYVSTCTIDKEDKSMIDIFLKHSIKKFWGWKLTINRLQYHAQNVKTWVLE